MKWKRKKWVLSGLTEYESEDEAWFISRYNDTVWGLENEFQNIDLNFKTLKDAKQVAEYIQERMI